MVGRSASPQGFHPPQMIYMMRYYDRHENNSKLLYMPFSAHLNLCLSLSPLTSTPLAMPSTQHSLLQPLVVPRNVQHDAGADGHSGKLDERLAQLGHLVGARLEQLRDDGDGADVEKGARREGQ
jgi:hypothetical protein